ncbi:VOC family protein [Mumia sp. DW29H23]|uniref:VOC family protein n=1 Tax=Mumia sp. DW29H23 TaxID=3421241 RepID=UPI003D69CD1F
MSVRAIPLLPCPSIDEMAAFFAALGFATTYRQTRPNPYVSFEKDGLELHYYGIAGIAPEDSHSTCVVMVDETGPWFEGFASGLRSRYGRLPLAGYPRITRPRRRKNVGDLSGFSLIDPAGNWIRFMRDAAPAPVPPEQESALATAYANAVVLADSHGDPAQAAKILAGAIGRDDGASPSEDHVQALAYLAELHVRTGDTDGALRALDALDGHVLAPEIEEAAAELRASVGRG